MQAIFLILHIFTYPIVGQIIDLPQSYISMGDIGYYFASTQGTDWLNDTFVSSLTECIHQCNQDLTRRTFDYTIFSQMSVDYSK